MKKLNVILAICTLLSVAACCNCETEPMVEKNHELIVPPNFGSQPK